MLAPEAQRALIGCEPVKSPRAKLLTKAKNIKLNIIQSSTNDAEKEKKMAFTSN